MAIHTKLYVKDSYTTDSFNYLVNTYIKEYDMAKANISILLSKGLISIEKYNYFINIPRIDRQIEIGKLMNANEDVYKALTSGFSEYRMKLFDANDIEEISILSIKKDAIYFINTFPKVLKFDSVEFIEKNIYTSYYKLDKIQLFYYYNSINNVEKIDIKGINDNVLHLHENHFLEFLCVVFHEIESGSLETALNIVHTFYNKYIRLELDVEYYRTFDSTSMYNIIPTAVRSYRVENIIKDDMYMMDISFNRNYISILHSYILDMIFAQRKRR